MITGGLFAVLLWAAIVIFFLFLEGDRAGDIFGRGWLVFLLILVLLGTWIGGAKGYIINITSGVLT